MIARLKIGSHRTTSSPSADVMWGAIVANLNATLPARAQPDLSSTPSPRPASGALQGQSEVDWSAIASSLNREASLKSPSRSHAR
jgi:hypothetical protein